MRITRKKYPMKKLYVIFLLSISSTYQCGMINWVKDVFNKNRCYEIVEQLERFFSDKKNEALMDEYAKKEAQRLDGIISVEEFETWLRDHVKHVFDLTHEMQKRECAFKYTEIRRYGDFSALEARVNMYRKKQPKIS